MTRRPARTAASVARLEALRPLLEALLADGAGCRTIGRRLADHGVLGATGRPMSGPSVRWVLRMLGLQTAFMRGDAAVGGDAFRRLQRAGIERSGRNSGLSPGTAAARARRSAAVADWAESLRPDLEAMHAAGWPLNTVVAALAAAGVRSAGGKPLTRSVITRAMHRLGIRTIRQRQPRS